MASHWHETRQLNWHSHTRHCSQELDKCRGARTGPAAGTQPWPSFTATSSSVNVAEGPGPTAL